MTTTVRMAGGWDAHNSTEGRHVDNASTGVTSSVEQDNESSDGTGESTSIICVQAKRLHANK
jgi:hypothetical protein